MLLESCNFHKMINVYLHCCNFRHNFNAKPTGIPATLNPRGGRAPPCACLWALVLHMAGDEVINTHGDRDGY